MNNETKNLMNDISSVATSINDSILTHQKNRDDEIKRQNEASEKSFNMSQKTFLDWFSRNKEYIIKGIIKNGFCRAYSLGDNWHSVIDLGDKFCDNNYPYPSNESHLDIILVKAFQGTKISAIHKEQEGCIEFKFKG